MKLENARHSQWVEVVERRQDDPFLYDGWIGRVVKIYPRTHHKYGMVCIVDADGNGFDVLPKQIEAR